MALDELGIVKVVGEDDVVVGALGITCVSSHTHKLY